MVKFSNITQKSVIFPNIDTISIKKEFFALHFKTQYGSIVCFCSISLTNMDANTTVVKNNLNKSSEPKNQGSIHKVSE